MFLDVSYLIKNGMFFGRWILNVELQTRRRKLYDDEKIFLKFWNKIKNKAPRSRSSKWKKPDRQMEENQSSKKTGAEIKHMFTTLKHYPLEYLHLGFTKRTIACVHVLRVVVFWAIQILVIQKCITSRKYAADRSFQICLFLILFTPSTVLTCQLGATTTWHSPATRYLFVGKMVSTGCSGKIQLALKRSHRSHATHA